MPSLEGETREPKFKEGDWGRVRATAPECSAPGERVQIIATMELEPYHPLVIVDGLPPGQIYICLFWIEESDWTCFVAEDDFEPDT
jgi:hypothetical protein